MKSKVRDTEVSFNVRPTAQTKMAKAKEENNTKLIEEIKEQEGNHEFLNLEEIMDEEKESKEYKFDHKRIKEIRERELRALQRRNQYQMAELKKDEQEAKKLKILDYWNYKERFKSFKDNIPQRNPFFNRQSIEQYIDVAFELKGPDLNKPHPTMTRLPAVRKKKVLDFMTNEIDDSLPTTNPTQLHHPPSVRGLSQSLAQQPLIQFQQPLLQFQQPSRQNAHQQPLTFQLQLQPSQLLRDHPSPPPPQLKKQSTSVRAGRAFFTNTVPSSPPKNNSNDQSLDDDGGNESSKNEDQKDNDYKPPPYNKKDLFSTLRNMDYGQIFAAQSPLTTFTKRFNMEVDKKQKATMIQDVLDYLDLDLAKMTAARTSQNKSVLVRNLSRPKKQALHTGMKGSAEMSIPNVYTIKELPSQKAILSPRLQRMLAKSESLQATKIKKYVYVSPSSKKKY